MKYKLLSQTRPKNEADRGYDLKAWEMLDHLYRGGFTMKENAGRYLPKCVGESQERYAARIGPGVASYIGYLAQIVHLYTAAAFAGGVSVGPAPDADDPATPGVLPEPEVWEAFAADANLRGSTFVEVLSGALTTALVKGKALIACDFPAEPEGTTVKSRSDSDQTGVDRPYIYELPPEQLVDWEYEADIAKSVDLGEGARVRFSVGRFAWCITKRETARRAAPNEERGAIVEEYRIWQRQEDGSITWELFRVVREKNKTIQPDTEIESESGPVTSSFREIPIVEIRLPEPLWIGNVAGPLNLEHYQRRSAMVAAMDRALLVILYAKLGPQAPAVGGSIPADIAEDQSRASDPRKTLATKGIVELADGDEIGYASPPTGAFDIVNNQLRELVDEIHRVTGRMAASISATSQALNRSGLSKEADNSDFCVVLKALGAILRDAARRVYTVLSDAREEDIVWTINGLDSYDPDEDRAAVMAEAQALAGTGAPVPIHSKTALLSLHLNLLRRMLPRGTDPATWAVIEGEARAAFNTEDSKPPLMLAPTDLARLLPAGRLLKRLGEEPFGDKRDDMTLAQIDAMAQAPQAPSAT